MLYSPFPIEKSKKKKLKSYYKTKTSSPMKHISNKGFNGNVTNFLFKENGFYKFR